MPVVVMAFAACSNQQLYESLRKRNEAECFKLPVPQQHECIENTRSVSYDDYQEELKKAAE